MTTTEVVHISAKEIHVKRAEDGSLIEAVQYHRTGRGMVALARITDEEELGRWLPE